MEVKIIKKVDKDRTNKDDKRKYLWFYDEDKKAKPNNGLEYKTNDIVFTSKKDGDDFKVEEYHTYNKLMNILNDDKINNTNQALTINKFTNLFNLKNEYSSDSEIRKKTQENTKLIQEKTTDTVEWLSFSLKVDDKIIIGLGNESVFETDITLHHTYGIPYIPGSALKGVLRNYIIQEYFKDCSDKCCEECNKECEKNAIRDSLFVKIFGGENKEGKKMKGKVIFMDSFPITDFKVAKDIMTPHHKKYYEGKKDLPLDNDDVTPIPFLVVEAVDKNNKLMFEINIGIDKDISNYKIVNEKEESINSNIVKKYENKKIQDFLKENLKDELNFYGIGAKTSVGYGYFNDIKVIEDEKLKKPSENDIQARLDGINKILDRNKKHKVIMDFYNNIDKLTKEQKNQLSKYMKESF